MDRHGHRSRRLPPSLYRQNQKRRSLPVPQSRRFHPHGYRPLPEEQLVRLRPPNRLGPHLHRRPHQHLVQIQTRQNPQETQKLNLF